jgi:hypothetical protein
MLVARADDGSIRWMDIRPYLKEHWQDQVDEPVREIRFRGEALSARTLELIRDGLLPLPDGEVAGQMSDRDSGTEKVV